MSISTAPAPPPPLTGIKLGIASIGISLGVFLVLLDVTVANVAVPHIAGTLGMSAPQGIWVITCYAVAEAICLPLTGWFARRFGSVRTYVFGLMGFMASSALCGAAQSMEMLVVCRVLQGFCGAPLVPLCQSLMISIFPKEKAGMAVAVSGMVAIIAPIAGPLVGGYITDDFSWRWIFYINIPFGVLAVFLVLRVMRPYETPKMIMPIDMIGLVLLVVWVGSLQIMLDLGREYDWFGSPLIVALAGIAAVGFIAFLIWELTEPSPIVELRILRHRGFWTSTLCLSIGYATMMVSSALIPLWAQTTMGYTATQAGMVLAPISLFSLVCVPLVGRLVHKVDPRILICWGLSWLGVIGMLRSNASTDLTIYWVAFPSVLQGFSTAFYTISLMVIALGSVEPREIPAAAGLMAFARTLATAAGISTVTTMWESGGREARAQLVGVMNGAPEAAARMQSGGLDDAQARSTLEQLLVAQSNTISLGHVFMMTGVLCLITAQLVWLIPRQQRH